MTQEETFLPDNFFEGTFHVEILKKFKFNYNKSALFIRKKFPQFNIVGHDSLSKTFHDFYVESVDENIKHIVPEQKHISGMGVPAEMLRKSRDLHVASVLHTLCAHPRWKIKKAVKRYSPIIFVGFDNVYF